MKYIYLPGCTHNISNILLAVPFILWLPGIQQPFNLQRHLSFLTQYDHFSNALRLTAIDQTDNKPHILTSDDKTLYLYRNMKFLKEATKNNFPPFFTISNAVIENFIESTKIKVDRTLQTPAKLKILPNKEWITIKSLKNSHIIIKPADKNLGTVIMNTNDYIDQCLVHLTSDSYIRVECFPDRNIRANIQNTLINFKNHLAPQYRLYKYLQLDQNHPTPKFYGLPKIHKTPDSNGMPPVRPIVAHTNSLLSKTAKFIDHILQPLAQAYHDYLKNSSQLTLLLETLTVPKYMLLVTLDVSNLYPSIPQKECLEVVRDEMMKFQDLIIYDPNLVLHLLNINMSNNYFQFGNNVFLQTKGTAMGAAFSPTVANIYMSVFLRRFLTTTTEKPFLIKRYIDDIFILWPKEQNLSKFLLDFQDLTIYKRNNFNELNQLSVRTFQKENNLYQYLHFSSSHPKTVMKGLITGEAIRYIRTNSTAVDYKKQLHKFISRLISRNYPFKFISKALEKADYNKRTSYLKDNINIVIKQPLQRPIFKCNPPPTFVTINVPLMSPQT